MMRQSFLLPKKSFPANLGKMEPSKISQLIKKSGFRGDIAFDQSTRKTFSHDASIFELLPKVVVSPKDSKDIEFLVKFVQSHKKNDSTLSLTARSAGTDMSGGSINDSIIVAFQKYMNRFLSLSQKIATCQPGMFYRDFEDETLKHHLIFPSYPASKDICAIGGIINNNSGGEKSLEYGKTEKYIAALKIVLSDGKEYQIKPLKSKDLKKKIAQDDFEGEIYRKTYKLICDNYDAIKKAKPDVSKNSAGYFLWNVYDKKTGIFDLTQLFVGAQGTLGLVTEAQIKLVPVKRFSQMVIIFLKNLEHLGQIINDVMPLEPESFETYDDQTLKLAIRFFSTFAEKLGTKNIINTAWHFWPEFLMVVTGGMPKLILLVEFTADNRGQIDEKIAKLKEELSRFSIKIRIAKTKKAAKKYWSIRRESFNLLRHNVKDKHTAPFIDDFAVQPKYLVEFLPKLDQIFAKYPSLIYTIAGHMGDGNFHIIPLMDIQDPKERAIIPKLSKEVYDLVLKYKGTTTAEHNDGLIRTPFLEQMYGQKIYKLFEETKDIFDPQNIFNPKKKVKGDLDYAMGHIRTLW